MREQKSASTMAHWKRPINIHKLLIRKIYGMKYSMNKIIRRHKNIQDWRSGPDAKNRSLKEIGAGKCEWLPT